MQLATHYPPDIIEKPSGEELAMMIDDMIDHISMRIEAEKNDSDDFDGL